MKHFLAFRILVLLVASVLFIADSSAQIEVIEPAQKVEVKEEHSEAPFITFERMPQFPGGEDALFKFIAANLKYPDTAIEAGIGGVVYVSFLVEQDGAIGEAKVLRGIGGGCDEEALRVVQLMPKWEPGVQRGEPVRVQYNLPLRFELETDDNK